VRSIRNNHIEIRGVGKPYALRPTEGRCGDVGLANNTDRGCGSVRRVRRMRKMVIRVIFGATDVGSRGAL
jgi:hypothetical protein